MISLHNIVQHYSKQDEKYVKKIFHLMEMVDNNLSIYDIGFCNPYEQKIIDDLIKHFQITQNKALNDTYERQFITLKANDSYQEISEKRVAFIEILYNKKFHIIKHNQVMGTLYNLGINEDKIGDIFVSADGACQFACSYDLKDSIIILINKIGNIAVTLNEISDITINNKEMYDKIRSSKSLRLDTVIKNLCQISRNEANKKISKNEIQINYESPKNNKVEINTGDLLSIKGYGRIIIKGIILNQRNYNIKYQSTKK